MLLVGVLDCVLVLTATGTGTGTGTERVAIVVEGSKDVVDADDGNEWGVEGGVPVGRLRRVLDAE
jgi:hypothetical protein